MSPPQPRWGCVFFRSVIPNVAAERQHWAGIMFGRRAILIPTRDFASSALSGIQPILTWADGPGYYISRLWR
jgi:hypothetical protein